VGDFLTGSFFRARDDKDYPRTETACKLSTNVFKKEMLDNRICKRLPHKKKRLAV
jgi:hypothetical protein